MKRYRFLRRYRSSYYAFGDVGVIVDFDEATADAINRDSPGVLEVVEFEETKAPEPKAPEPKPKPAEVEAPESEPETRATDKPGHDRQVKSAPAKRGA